MKPLLTYKLPLDGGPNVFGAIRKYDVHTGVDLFCNDGDAVYSMYDGIVTNVIEFTGFTESPWWNDTYAVMIFHPEINKTFLYGELDPAIKEGDVISVGEYIGAVKTVLKHDKGLPMTMLHMECYSGWQTNAVWWYHNENKPQNLEDIMIFLK